MSGASELARLAVLVVVICLILGPTYRKTGTLVGNFSIKLEHSKTHSVLINWKRKQGSSD